LTPTDPCGVKACGHEMHVMQKVYAAASFLAVGAGASEIAMFFKAP